MADVARRVALLAAWFLLALPATALAGSAQANLAVGVVVPAPCALRVAAALPSGVAAGASRGTVVMKCTKGTLPPSDGSTARRASAVGPRITRAVLTSLPEAIATPRPRAERDPAQARAHAVAAPILVVTVNF